MLFFPITVNSFMGMLILYMSKCLKFIIIYISTYLLLSPMKCNSTCSNWVITNVVYICYKGNSKRCIQSITSVMIFFFLTLNIIEMFFLIIIYSKRSKKRWPDRRRRYTRSRGRQPRRKRNKCPVKCPQRWSLTLGRPSWATSTCKVKIPELWSRHYKGAQILPTPEV